MVNFNQSSLRRLCAKQHGVSLLEVLVTLLILAIGLLGLAGLQARLQTSEMEAYQRSQALILLNDMASRISVNRSAAASYVTGAGNPTGAGVSCPAATATTNQRDLRDWCLALQGASETSGGSSVGAMIGGRGCVESLGGGEYMVTVAWQGISPLTSPAGNCGINQYNSGGGCVNDLCRRTVTTSVRIANLAS